MGKWNRLIPGKDLSEWAWFFGPCALLIIPFVVYVKSNTYPIMTPETLWILFGFFLAGIFLGILGQMGAVLRALTFAATLTLLIDVQTRWFIDYSLHQYIWIPIGLYALALMSPEFIRTFALVTVYATLVAVLVTPQSQPIQVAEFDAKLSGKNMLASGDRPNTIWIHIIVDEQIGIESIPVEFDGHHRLANRLKSDYISDGFTVYGRAFSHFPQTIMSLPNILNLSNQHPKNFLSSSLGEAGSFWLTQSNYFDRLRRQGFDIHVYSMDFFRTCDPRRLGLIKSCYTYRANSIWGLSETSLSKSNKAFLMLRIYARLSKVYDKLVTVFDIDGHFSLPRSVGPLVSLKVFDRFRKDVLKAELGSVWLIHIPLPHDPYALNRDCSIKNLPWLENGEDSDLYQMNSVGARRANYSHYLEQVECVNQQLQSLFDALKSSGSYDKAHIVVHGDHGSRIGTHNLRHRPSYRQDFRPSAENMVDVFGTLFAYKPPGSSAGTYRREMESVSALLDKVSAGRANDRENGEDDPVAYLVEWSDEACQGSISDMTQGCRLLPVTMPNFSYGKVETEKSSELRGELETVPP